MPYRIDPSYGVFQSGKYVYGITEIAALMDMMINGKQVPRRRLQRQTPAELDAWTINQVVYESVDTRYFNITTAHENKTNYVIYVTYDIADRYTANQLAKQLGDASKVECKGLGTRAAAARDAEFELEGATQYYNDLVQYLVDLKAAWQNNIKPGWATAAGTSYQAVIDYEDTWRNFLPTFPEDT